MKKLNNSAKEKTRTSDHSAKFKNYHHKTTDIIVVDLPIGTSKQIEVNSVCIFIYINHIFDETIPLKCFLESSRLPLLHIICMEAVKMEFTIESYLI